MTAWEAVVAASEEAKRELGEHADTLLLLARTQQILEERELAAENAHPLRLRAFEVIGRLKARAESAEALLEEARGVVEKCLEWIPEPMDLEEPGARAFWNQFLSESRRFLAKLKKRGTK